MPDFHKIIVGDRVITPIDWEMNPSLSFGTFESWGGRNAHRANNNEKVYYFFIDNWGEEPKLCLMERAIKHAKIIAEIAAPTPLLVESIARQGKAAIFEKSYGVDEEIKLWLIEHVLHEEAESSLIIPIIEEKIAEEMGELLQTEQENPFSGDSVQLPIEWKIINDNEIESIIKQWNFFDREVNPKGDFTSHLVRGNDDKVVMDLRTNLMWQCGGLDINSIRTIKKRVSEINKTGFAGFNDWRLPTLEEAMSLMQAEKNSKSLYLPLCFEKQYAFIFVNAERRPGGYWFVDFKQGRAFWSSGTIPGGFGRLVRKYK